MRPFNKKFLLIVVFTLTLFCFLLNNSFYLPTFIVYAQTKENILKKDNFDFKKTIEKEGEVILKKTFQFFKNLWQKIFGWGKEILNSYIFPFLKDLWQKISSFLNKEVEKKKPEVKEELKKEGQEIKEEIETLKKSQTLWERIKEFIK